MKNLLKNNSNFVSVIIPCRNEEKFIAECLDSIIRNDFPKEKLEVLIVDGMSEDRTREIIKKYIKKYSFVKILDNVKKITPCALNIGVRNAKGEFIIIAGAHSIYENGYISKCIKYSEKYKCDNIGGILKPIFKKDSIINKAIALSLSNSFGAGDAYYKIGDFKETKLVDTVFGGCYRKEIFNKVGFFNENLVRGQDMEFNLRLKKASGKILLVPDIIAYYYPKSNFKDFFIHNFKSGMWVVFSAKFIKRPLKLRHYIPLIFVLSMLILIVLSIFLPFFLYLFLLEIGLYFFVNLCFSIKIALRQKDLRYFFIMPFIFANRHISYGLGSILGLNKSL